MDGAGIGRGRHAFFDDGQLPLADVRQSVLQSWVRCTDLGLSPSRRPHIGPIAETDLAILRQHRESLRRLCRPELEMLSGDARETGSVVILADADGVILDTVGDTRFLSSAAQVALRPGVAWTEANIGTNAIGTALAERRPVAVHGSEHFFAEHAMLGCAATPILDPRGAIIGALDVSGPSATSQGFALGLIRLAVDQIEHRLFRSGFSQCRVLRLHDDAAMLDTAREGILVFREDRLVGANRRGLSLIGRGWDALDDGMLDALFDERTDRRPARAGTRATFRLRTGAMLIGGWDQPAAAGSPPCQPATGDVRPLADGRAGAIEAALALHDGNITAAARQLRIHRSTIHRHLAQRAH